MTVCAWTVSAIKFNKRMKAFFVIMVYFFDTSKVSDGYFHSMTFL